MAWGGESDMNYCACGEYLPPGQSHCADPRYGCGRRRRGLYCHGFYHQWDGPSRLSDPPEKCDKCGRVRLDIFLRGLRYRERGREYWTNVFRRVYDEAFSTEEGADPVARIRLRRYEERLPKVVRGRDPVADYGEGVGQQIRAAIREMTDNLSTYHHEYCIDNTRFSARDNRADMRRYRKKQKRGCCGSHDQDIVVCGRDFVIGCNYGH